MSFGNPYTTSGQAGYFGTNLETVGPGGIVQFTPTAALTPEGLAGHPQNLVPINTNYTYGPMGTIVPNNLQFGPQGTIIGTGGGGSPPPPPPQYSSGSSGSYFNARPN